MAAVTISRNAADPAGVSSTANVTSYAGIATGTADPTRVGVAVIGKEVATVVVNSVTINDGTTTRSMISAGAVATFGNQAVWIYYLPLPNGTTATVDITWSGAITNVQNHLTLYTVNHGAFPPRVYGTNTSTDMDATVPLTTGSQTINANGGAIAAASCATDTVAKTWANITEDLDVDAGDFRWTTATRTTALAATAMTCTGATNGEDGAMGFVIVDESVLPQFNVAAQRPAAFS